MKAYPYFFVLFSLFLIFSLSFVSAGFLSDLFHKKQITGDVIAPITDTDCVDTCASLDYQCGTARICEDFVDCGICSSGYMCVNGECLNTNSTYSCEGLLNFSFDSFYACAENGYPGICFNKFSGDYLACGNLSGIYCTFDNAYAEENIICSTCSEGDEGIDYYTKEFIYGTDKEGLIISSIDSCLPDNKNVLEGYCNSEGYADFITYTCPYGCKNGVCNKWYTTFFKII